MNKSVMIAVLFCLTSFTGCLGGDDLEKIEEIQEEEKIEPVGENDLSNVSKELESLKKEVDQFLADYKALQSEVNSNHNSIDLNATNLSELNDRFGKLNDRLAYLEKDYFSFEQNVREELEKELSNVTSELNQIQGFLSQATAMRENLKSSLDNLTIMHLMDDNQKASFHKMVLIDIIKRNGVENIDLREADLSGSDLSGVDFSNADLSGAKLHGSRFVGTTFANAKLDNTTAAASYFRLCDFEGALVRGGNWAAVEMERVTLENANFHGTNMEFSTFSDVDASNATFDKANLENSEFEIYAPSSSWKGVNFDDSTITLSVFVKADFSTEQIEKHTTMRNVEFSSVVFDGAKLAYTDMSNIHISAHSDVLVSDRPMMSVYSNPVTTYYLSGGAERMDIEANSSNKYRNYSSQLHVDINCASFRFVDFNNTRLDDAKICTDYGETATFNGSHFRRADMNRVTFGSPSHSSDDWIIPSGCLHIRNEFRLMETCISLENTKFSQAILDNSFIHASVAGASMAGISVGGVNWDNTLWHDTIWVNSDVITGRGNPKNWDRYSS